MSTPIIKKAEIGVGEDAGQELRPRPKCPQNDEGPLGWHPGLLPRTAHHQHGPDDEGRQERIEGER